MNSDLILFIFNVCLVLTFLWLDIPATCGLRRCVPLYCGCQPQTAPINFCWHMSYYEAPSRQRCDSECALLEWILSWWATGAWLCSFLWRAHCFTVSVQICGQIMTLLYQTAFSTKIIFTVSTYLAHHITRLVDCLTSDCTLLSPPFLTIKWAYDINCLSDCACARARICVCVWPLWTPFTVHLSERYKKYESHANRRHCNLFSSNLLTSFV
jgi:hypothetical protein